MKNHEEFRQIVFEKAKIYEDKRKKRRKKIIEAASLCSLCVVIGISAYFGLGSLHLMEEDAHIAVTEAHSLTENGFSHQEIVPTNGEESSSVAPSPTSTAAYSTCTTEETVAATSRPPAETTTTVCETSAYITVTEVTLEIYEESYTLLGEFDYEQTDTAEVLPNLIVCDSLSALESVLANGIFPHISPEALSFLRHDLDEAYFEEHSLVLLLSSDAWLWEAQLSDGVFTYSAIGENPSGEGKLSFLLYSVQKELLTFANLLMENNE